MQFTAPLLQNIDYLLTRLSLHTCLPVISVDNIVRFDAPQIFAVVQRVLRKNLGDAVDVLNHGFSLVITEIRQPLIAGDRRIGEKSDDHITQLAGLLDNIDMTRMHQIGAHADIYFFNLRQFERLLNSLRG